MTWDTRSSIIGAMHGTRRAIAPWAWWAFSLLLAVAATATRGGHEASSGDAWGQLALAIGWPLAGAIVLSQRPGHTVGRLMIAVGVASALALALHEYVYASLDRPGDEALPLTTISAWAASWMWAFGTIPAVTLMPLVFPDGRLAGRRWSIPAVGAAVAMAGMVGGTIIDPGPLPDFASIENPTGVAALGGVAEVVRGVSFPLFVAGVIGAAASLVARWRRGNDVVRHQLRWFTGAVVLLVAAVIADGMLLFGPFSGAVVFTVLLLPAAAVVVAVLRFHLYGIDLIVNRSLVYGALTLAAFGLYLGVVVTLGSVAGSVVGSVVATAAVAVAFQPLRLGLQRGIDRLLYGDRRAPEAARRRLDRRLATTGIGDLLQVCADELTDALRVRGVAVSAGSGSGEDRDRAVSGLVVGDAHCVPLIHEDVVAGEVEIATTEADVLDERVLHQILPAVALAARMVALTADVRRSREEAVVGREEERRRIRRDLHDGLGPALAGVALGLEGASDLVRVAPDHAAERLAQLREDIVGVIAEVRKAVYGLRPSALDELGLVPALRERAEAIASGSVAVELDLPDNPPDLAAALEAAIFRIATEAMTNVVRHSRARHCTVRLEMGDPISLIVEDDGIGCNGARGVGMMAMSERAAELGGSLAVENAGGGGTRVVARLPLVR